jgi:hypothetical protein
MKPQYFKYTLTEEWPLEAMTQRFSDHHRLATFVNKGCTCVTCGRVGTRFIKGVDGSGGIHWDLYTDDLVPITVDHIIPRSLGGPDHLDNYQPMCFPCNMKKGNGQDHNNNKKVYEKTDYIKVTKFAHDFLIGKEIWKIIGTKFPRALGIVESVSLNPHTENPALVVVKGSKFCYYDIKKSLYIKK